MRGITRGFVPLEPLPKVTFDDETAPHEHVEGPIQRCRTHRRSTRAHFTCDLFDRQVTIGCQYDIGDRKTLSGDGEIMLPEIDAKCFEIGFGAHAGSASAARKASP